MILPKIRKIHAREVLDSRGDPTVEAVVVTNSGSGMAMVPSGASTGKHEALELRDGGKRLSGKGVLKAVGNINKVISKKLIGEDCRDQRRLDNLMIELDGTENKSSLGANAILAVSMAICKAGAISSKLPLYRHISRIAGAKEFVLPVPQMNILDGGAHVGAENDVQEYMIIPYNFRSFSESLIAGMETYHSIKNAIKKKYSYKAVSVTAEGGFIAPIEGVRERLEFLQRCIEEAGYGNKISLALDAASSEFYQNGKYTIGKKSMSAGEMIDLYKELIDIYPVVSIEDGMAEDDWEGWSLLNREIGNKVQLVGDDLLVTNIGRIKMALDHRACNALLLKVNQIGTVTEAIDAANIAVKNKWNVIISHRSGETEDNFIADLAVGSAATQSKFGAPARSDRNAKYNQLLRIEEELGSKARFKRIKYA
ncbi:phosphopyruvate hydratase [Candidatus Woesearchaeota archaeon]|nr:phosphopyruvate hydratase [Candidatus Woesearchaeota archaeon]